MTNIHTPITTYYVRQSPGHIFVTSDRNKAQREAEARGTKVLTTDPRTQR